MNTITCILSNISAKYLFVVTVIPACHSALQIPGRAIALVTPFMACVLHMSKMQVGYHTCQKAVMLVTEVCKVKEACVAPGAMLDYLQCVRV